MTIDIAQIEEQLEARRRERQLEYARDPKAAHAAGLQAAAAAVEARRSPAERAGDPTPAELQRLATFDAAVEAAASETIAARNRLASAQEADHAAAMKHVDDDSFLVSWDDSSAVGSARREFQEAELAEGNARVRANDLHATIGEAGRRRRIAADAKAAAS